MDVSVGGRGSRRSDGGDGVVVGSVWERRMRSDQVKGGIKVFGIVDGLNDDVEDCVVKIKSVGNLEREGSTTVRKSRRTWRNRDEPGTTMDLHPAKEFDEFEETFKELGVCHVGRVKSGSDQKVQRKFLEFGNGGNNDSGDDEFFDDEGLEGDGLNDGNEEVDFGKISGPNKIRKSCGTEQQRTRKVVSGDKKVNNHFPYDGKPKSNHVTKGSPPTGSGVHKECREQDSSNDGCTSEERIVWQSIVDLALWRDVTQKALVFVLGSLVVILSSFTGKLDISFVSLISHLGFFALATIFMCKSIFSRDGLDQDETASSVWEEEALNFTRSVLPYINDVLLKFRAVLSGDPAITIKLAVILFVIARWVDYLSVATVLKLGIFGAFTLPKLYSKYSKQIHGHGISCIRHIEDAWESFSHKRTFALVAFLILWNFSSAISRVCLGKIPSSSHSICGHRHAQNRVVDHHFPAVFLVYLALRYHEHSSAGGNSSNSRRSPAGVEGK